MNIAPFFSKAEEKLNCNLFLYVVRCAIWYHLYNLKNVENTHGGVLILILLHWCFSRFFKLYKWYQTAQRITYVYLLRQSCIYETLS